jgi:putative membrane protein
MKFTLRWVANAIAFYLALYLLDSLTAPRFYLQAVWAAVVMAVLLALFNSLIRPLHRLRSRPYRALTVAFFTLVVNALVLQIFVWAGARVSATNVAWVLVAAVFIQVLGGVINWLIGFRVKEKPGALTPEQRASTRSAELQARGARDREGRGLRSREPR